MADGTQLLARCTAISYTPNMRLVTLLAYTYAFHLQSLTLVRSIRTLLSAYFSFLRHCFSFLCFVTLEIVLFPLFRRLRSRLVRLIASPNLLSCFCCLLNYEPMNGPIPPRLLLPARPPARAIAAQPQAAATSTL